MKFERYSPLLTTCNTEAALLPAGAQLLLLRAFARI
jgi:hypothetical protein